MDEKLMEVSFGLIANAGEAKALAFDAISKSKEGNFEEAKTLIEKSKKEMHKAHAFQTELITKEASGENVVVNVLLVHAQDHLMNSMNYQQLAEEFITLYERIDKIEKSI
ncbi:PTS lactose/cellobiose transporter subunit IIA [Clostridium septicum]|uniref:PTS lactose/cellobiose transporter subunit IIA n=1 Tax=Clostridium septicum TaxID=1504 RepID=A0A9N7JIM9_CLOSE|nr:PTS lactose/cellobiose transporter subunit IIA [Clostridium septicum]AYE33228.1 PTS lactose/cellobiose transporter subunit IIA [Clostridium septicum]MDU1314421.1 PTS lactose/cellobiose transporter subunit IIA [Clostridium septicum]QAS61400.1 PTS lactose/cellobiose transporter subunit IIA [Clostridium septicum]UEC22169.1 PTS lactose/cellobiose transporter subunit IIA [Clostridium septicum]USR99800.1 PTS lactose/cellobiose transporter subunit IIA [Clostridium septicum]